ncbi:MAG: quinolinate synthase NadA [Verrucomicrobiota bacterium]
MQDLMARVAELKKAKNAVILAHSYQNKEIQEAADFVGDSLGLSYEAQKTTADVIIFCGVHFMAETAKIINPSKTVILPDLEAGCSLADACTADELQTFLKKNPGYYVVSYVNCSAAVKALSDVICTSSNAVKIVNQIPQDKKILFVPDRHLGEWAMEKTGREMKLWDGSCHVHVAFTQKSVKKIQLEHPDAPLVAHPECAKEVRDLADEVCSTEKMVAFCKNSPAKKFIIATEHGMLFRLQRELPEKEFIPAPTGKAVYCANTKSPCAECAFMKMNTLEKVVHSLETLQPQIELPQEIITKACTPIQRMLDWSRPNPATVTTCS